MDSGRPLLEKNIVPIQAAIIDFLDTYRDILFQKARRQSNRDGLLEMTATWVGMDSDPRTVVSTFKKTWPGPALEGSEEKFWIGESDDSILLLFAASYPENRYLTGRILITFQ
jgi:hypothetical protein